jgi:hypothetical protein
LCKRMVLDKKRGKRQQEKFLHVVKVLSKLTKIGRGFL